MAIAVILWGVLLGLVEVVRYELRRIRKKAQLDSLKQVRHVVGSYLLLGLEFLIAADIIRTIIQPSLEDLAILGSIVVIRTVIGYFLGREMAEGK